MSDQEYNHEDSFGFILGRSQKMLANRLTQNFRSAGHNLTVEQWSVLVNLWRSDGQNQQDLSCKCGKDKTSITRLIDNMEKGNLVVRIPDQNDRRNKLIYLTNQGKEIRNNLTGVAKQTLAEALEGISESEIEQCKGILNQVFDNLSCTKE